MSKPTLRMRAIQLHIEPTKECETCGGSGVVAEDVYRNGREYSREVVCSECSTSDGDTDEFAMDDADDAEAWSL